MKRCECGKEIGIKRTLCVTCENKIKDEYTYQVQYRYKDKKYSNFYESFSSAEECKKYIESLDKSKYSLIRIVKVDFL